MWGWSRRAAARASRSKKRATRLGVERFAYRLHRDDALEGGVASPIDLAHPSCACFVEDLEARKHGLFLCLANVHGRALDQVERREQVADFVGELAVFRSVVVDRRRLPAAPPREIVLDQLVERFRLWVVAGHGRESCSLGSSVRSVSCRRRSARM